MSSEHSFELAMIGQAFYHSHEVADLSDLVSILCQTKGSITLGISVICLDCSRHAPGIVGLMMF